MKNENRVLSLLTALLALFFLRCPHSAGAEEYTGLMDYQSWAVNVGYPQGLLIPLGIDGINQDCFRSRPESAGYTSGRIVIGDSRSCQLGIRQNVTGSDDYAVFAVWGGHYVPGTVTPILTAERLAEIEQCFHEQIRMRGKCTVFFFATVNDYEFMNNHNAGFISSAVTSAEEIASMTFEYEGNVYHPEIIVIGFDGGRTDGDIFGIPQETFNRYIDSYNQELREAVDASPILKETAEQFTTVSEITGRGTTFISDGLHYGDNTLQQIADYMKNIQ